MSRIEYEKETCGRCGGCGRYSYNQITGDTCFGCGGSGKRLTKRGRAAHDWMRARLATDALNVGAGDRVRYHNALSGKIATFTVAEVQEGRAAEGIRHVMLVSTGGKTYSFGGAIPLERVPNAEDISAAIAYQDSLTKAGKPRKRQSQSS